MKRFPLAPDFLQGKEKKEPPRHSNVFKLIFSRTWCGCLFVSFFTKLVTARKGLCYHCLCPFLSDFPSQGLLGGDDCTATLQRPEPPTTANALT